MNLTAILTAAQQPASDRTARYSARLDAHLPTLPSAAARRAFLRREQAKWDERYREWAAEVDAGGDDRGYTAWDFTLTLAELGRRLSGYPAAVAP